MYGSRFDDAWRGTRPEVLVKVWATGLTGYTGREVKRGMEACKAMRWPPTLPEFLLACRPTLDADDAYYEAVDQMPRRADGTDEWSNAAIYHAACLMWFDLRTQPYAAIRGRWARTLTRAVEDVAAGRLADEVPAPALALTDDRKTSPMPEGVRARLKALTEKLTGRAS